MQRRDDLDRVKGLAILLVVFGHLVARADPAHVIWYEPLRRAVYAFHMPLFLYVSGMVAVLSGGLFTPRRLWGRQIGQRARRLLLPFFGLGLLVLAGKMLLRHAMFVDHAPAGLSAGLAGLFWHTAVSPALSIWYLFVLFVVSLASMVALEGRPSRLPWLLAASLALYTLPVPEYFYLDRVCGYAVFFLAGAAAALSGARWDEFMRRRWRGLLGVFLVLLGLDAVFGANLPGKVVLLPLGLLSMPVIHGWLRFSPLSSARLWLVLGRYSFMIYLFNTLFIGVAKGILLRFCSWDGGHFLPFAVVLMASGVLGPMALKAGIFRVAPALDRMTD